MADDEFDNLINLANTKVFALLKEAAALHEVSKGDDSEVTHSSVVEMALQLAAIEIIALETEAPDPDKLREWVSNHARALRDA